MLLGTFFLLVTGAALTPVRPDDAGPSISGVADRLGEGVALIQARKLYLSACADCHGARGHGTDKAPVDFADARALVALPRETFRAKLTAGHGAPVDAALGEAERTAITAYVRTYLMLPAPDADTEVGRAIYARSCSVCHGDRGDAASWAKNSLSPPPADFTAHTLEQLSRQEMIDSVTFGRDRSAMVAFATQLSRDEIAATVDFIRAAFMRDDRGGTATAEHAHGGERPGNEPPFPDGVIGDPAWGKAFYLANCAECHGKDGNGEGPRAYFMIVKPASFLSHERRGELVRPVLFQRIAKGVDGTTMPAWEKVLSEKQIASVGEYIYRAFLHPEKAEGNDKAPGWRAADPATGDQKKK